MHDSHKIEASLVKVEEAYTLPSSRVPFRLPHTQISCLGMLLAEVEVAEKVVSNVTKCLRLVIKTSSILDLSNIDFFFFFVTCLCFEGIQTD